MEVNLPRERWLDAERGVIGAMLIDPELVPAILAAVREEDFQIGADLRIFQEARALFREGAAADPITIRNRIGPQLTDYMVQVMELTPTAAGWEEYAAAMREQALLQRARDVSRELLAACSAEECRAAASKLAQLLADGAPRENSWTAKEMMEDFMRRQSPEAAAPQYITTGFRVLDAGTYIEPGDVVVLGGYASDGKTALSLMLAWHMAQSRSVGYFSLETSRQKLADRMIACTAQVELPDIKRRSIPEEAWRRIASQTEAYSTRKLRFVHSHGWTVDEIAAYSQAAGFRVIFVDYVQLLQAGEGRGRTEQMAAVSRALHTFAQKTGTLVVELAQLSRQEQGLDKNGQPKWREPTMHDLKESGQFEQDADLILLLFRPGPQERDLNPECHRILKIGKNKEGRWGSWAMYFDGSRQTFTLLDRSRDVMRTMVSEGKKARMRREPEYRQVELEELPSGQETLPF